MKRSLLLLVLTFLGCDTESQRPFRGEIRRDALSTDVVISEVYGGAASTGAVYRHDFVELLNRGSAAVDVSNWSVQYTGATSGGWQVTSLGSFGMLQPGQRLLVRMGTQQNMGAALPAHDVSGNSAMSATTGKVALVRNTTGLATACPQATAYVDLVGYGAMANCSEGAVVPTLAADVSAQRRLQGCRETDDNASDFLIAAPTPQGSTTGTVDCTTAMDPDAGTATCRQLSTFNVTYAEGGYDAPGAFGSLYDELSDGGVELLTLELYYPDAGLTLPVTETFTSSTTYETCRTCAWIGTECDPLLGCVRFFLAQSGTATVTQADRNPAMGRIAGSLSNVKFVEWDFMTDQLVGGGDCIELSSQAVDVMWSGGGPTGGGGGSTTGGGGGSMTGGGGGSMTGGGGGAMTGGGGGSATGGGAGTGGGAATGGGSATGGGGGSDAGMDTEDAGVPDAGTGGGKIGGKSGCGCTTGGEGSIALAMLGLVMMRTRRRS